MKCVSTVYAVGLAALMCGVLSHAEAASVHNKGRTTRGFKNAALSTARGFGKRADHRAMFLDMEPGSDPGRELFGRILSDRPESSDSFPVEWFAEELASNPELARLVTTRLAEELMGNIELARALTSRFVDKNQDGELTADELFRPNY